jgi:hypothetical protein
MEWFLVIFLYTTKHEYVDKVAIPMPGPITQYCKQGKEGNLVFKKPLEGTDDYIVYNVCVTKNHWRGVDDPPKLSK